MQNVIAQLDEIDLAALDQGQLYLLTARLDQATREAASALLEKVAANPSQASP